MFRSEVYPDLPSQHYKEVLNVHHNPHPHRSADSGGGGGGSGGDREFHKGGSAYPCLITKIPIRTTFTLECPTNLS